MRISEARVQKRFLRSTNSWNGAGLCDHLAEASERADDLVGQNGRSFSEHMASDELVRRLLDGERHVDGVPQVRSTDDEAMVLHNHGGGILGNRRHRIGQLSGSRHDERDARNLADESGLRRNR